MVCSPHHGLRGKSFHPTKRSQMGLHDIVCSGQVLSINQTIFLTCFPRFVDNWQVLGKQGIYFTLIEGHLIVQLLLIFVDLSGRAEEADILKKAESPERPQVQAKGPWSPPPLKNSF